MSSAPYPQEPKSKSQLKREADALHRLGERLVSLSVHELAKIPLNADLREAIEQTRSIRSHPARRRQLRLVGKYLRAADTQAIRDAMERLDREHNAAVRRLQEVECWRDRLAAGDDQTLSELLTLYPGADRQRLRQLMRAAQKELGAGRPPAASRKLFRYLRQLITNSAPET